MNKPIPIYLFSGFLGSGKTTLLNQVLDALQESGKKPAILMNEIGDINIDGQMLDANVPMAEMLSGCICCTISGDLSMTIYELMENYEPDIILIEATGIANPMEIIHSITEASLLKKVELKFIVTVIDAPHLLELSLNNKGRTYRLMEEQIRCAGWLVLNKADKVSAHELLELQQKIRGWNAFAPIRATVHCQGSIDFLDEKHAQRDEHYMSEGSHESGACDHADHDQHADLEHPEDEGQQGNTHAHPVGEHTTDHACVSAAHHHSHEHVMVYTHYFEKPIDRDRFELLISKLPREVYRAKGLLRFTDDEQPYLFQFAYRELEILKIRPKADVPSVAVFIGENFSKEEIVAAVWNMQGD
ncbi:CobW family GTP-binding protein [Paenibacillus eucommiae]|uniref:G3E family GTPase n=1 Tax=Paenibacillus eucommiae TaxID=1355755 RepID=A0ABS4IR38_9BACL|nr:GTP-binding protein [Paenibacillus eucommiae]MBP1990036.1 G3E family GTPase [Paenibacillus eucommiae]